jgi:hypothetical protein
LQKIWLHVWKILRNAHENYQTNKFSKAAECKINTQKTTLHLTLAMNTQKYNEGKNSMHSSIKK